MFLHTFTNILVKEIVWYLSLFPSLSPIMLDCMKRWKHSYHTGLMQIQHLYSNYFFVVLIGCSRHLMLTAREVFDIHRFADNTKMKHIFPFPMIPIRKKNNRGARGSYRSTYCTTVHWQLTCGCTQVRVPLVSPIMRS